MHYPSTVAVGPAVTVTVNDHPYSIVKYEIGLRQRSIMTLFDYVVISVILELYGPVAPMLIGVIRIDSEG